MNILPLGIGLGEASGSSTASWTKRSTTRKEIPVLQSKNEIPTMDSGMPYLEYVPRKSFWLVHSSVDTTPYNTDEVPSGRTQNKTFVMERHVDGRGDADTYERILTCHAL